nr:contractile injection system protein, VgrG/Pvc8 family [Escherichia coli]
MRTFPPSPSWKSSQDEARYEVRLEPRMALLTRSRQNAIYQNQTVPQIVEKILRERK